MTKTQLLEDVQFLAEIQGLGLNQAAEKLMKIAYLGQKKDLLDRKIDYYDFAHLKEFYNELPTHRKKGDVVKAMRIAENNLQKKERRA